MKALTIALDGSTYHGSVALLRGEEVVAERTLGGDTEEGGIQRSGKGENLMPAIADCLKEVAAQRGEIARVVCGGGPGSFTSLRVAGSVAKGLAVGYGVELYAVPSLLLTVAGVRPRLAPAMYLSLLNAMREEFFAQRVEVGADGSTRLVGRPGLISKKDLAHVERAETDLRCIGPGQVIDTYPHARGVAPLLGAVVDGGAVDIASWEPDYGRLAEAQVRWEAEHGRPLPR